jgi:hypothetical protein
MGRSPYCRNGGREPKQNSGDDRNTKGEQQDSRVRRRAHGNPRTTLAHKCNQDARGRERNGEPQKPTSNRKQKSFDQALPRNPRSARSKRQPGGDLALASCRPRQQEIREIGTGNQQHQQNHCHKNPQGEKEEGRPRRKVWVSDENR